MSVGHPFTLFLGTCFFLKGQKKLKLGSHFVCVYGIKNYLCDKVCYLIIL